MGWYCCDGAPWLLIPLSTRGAYGYSSLLMDKMRLGAPWVWMYTWGRGGCGWVKWSERETKIEQQERAVDVRRSAPESSGRCRSLHSTGTHSRSQDAGSGNCLLCRHRCLCSLLLSRPRRERWSFCPHPGHSLQTTAQGDRRMYADPPEDVICKERCKWQHIYSSTIIQFRPL